MLHNVAINFHEDESTKNDDVGYSKVNVLTLSANNLTLPLLALSGLKVSLKLKDITTCKLFLRDKYNNILL